VTKNKPTKARLNLLTNFRQQVYALFENQRDVLFEITDAIVQTPGRLTVLRDISMKRRRLRSSGPGLTSC
jgi:hypothetical protein